jgi:oligoendopeptidase F
MRLSLEETRMSTAVANTLPKRSAVPDDLKWDLTTIYPSDEAWEKDFQRVKALIPKVTAYQGKLGESGKMLLEAFAVRDEASQILGKLYVYANMRLHEDTRVATYQALSDRAETLSNELSAASSFMTPEILSIQPEKLQGFIKDTKGLELYKFKLDELNRRRPHIRSAEVESLLAQANDVCGTSDRVYEQFTTADMKLPQVEDKDGNMIQMTQGNYGARFLDSRDRAERQRGFEAMLGTYQKYRNTFGALYAAQVKSDIFNARSRNYQSSIEAALDSINVPVAVYSTLIETVHQNLPKLHRYLELRKRALGVSDLRMYDLYVPIVKDVDYKIEYDEAVETILKALQPLGKEYVDALRQGFKSRWVDVMENEGKRSGAYSWGSYGTNPFMLMNWQDTMDSMFTLAHEAGHAMHSFFTRRTQPYPYGNYTLFVAEVASTCNEALLRHHLLETVSAKAIRALVINDALEGFRTTLYRQALFAEFERDAHARAEAGEALTPELLCKIFRALNDKYYGPVVAVDDLIEIEWARIPHFYSPFYVYQYSTGISVATALAHQITAEGEPAIKRYLRFLSSGSSDYSINLLRDAGVDLSTPKPIQQALDTFEKYLDEFEKVLS